MQYIVTIIIFIILCTICNYIAEDMAIRVICIKYNEDYEKVKKEYREKKKKDKRKKNE